MWVGILHSGEVKERKPKVSLREKKFWQGYPAGGGGGVLHNYASRLSDCLPVSSWSSFPDQGPLPWRCPACFLEPGIAHPPTLLWGAEGGTPWGVRTVEAHRADEQAG